MSFVWKVEDMALMNEKSNIYIGNEKIYKAENELTREEKIEFLDSMNDGLTSYILGLADKLKEDKANGVIKKGKYGQMSAISFAAWLAENYATGYDTCPKCGATGKKDVISVE